MFEKIIVPLDGSELSAAALIPAKQIAITYGADLLLVRAIQPQQYAVADPIGNIHFWPDTPEGELHAYTEQYLREMAAEIDHPALIYVDTGKPAEVILDIAARTENALIVMSMHDYTRAERWLYGSVTAGVMPFAPCPLLVVHSAENPQHILLPLDRSRFAEQIIDPTLALARAFDAKITLLTVEKAGLHHNEEMEAMIAKSDEGLAERYRVDFYERSREYLRAVAARYPDLELDIAVTYGSPARRIIEAAELFDCDLIAMSTHGRTGLERWRFGSVASKVLHHAPVNLLVRRPHDLDDCQ